MVFVIAAQADWGWLHYLHYLEQRLVGDDILRNIIVKTSPQSSGQSLYPN